MKLIEELYRNILELIQLSSSTIASFIKEDIHLNL